MEKQSWKNSHGKIVMEKQSWKNSHEDKQLSRNYGLCCSNFPESIPNFSDVEELHALVQYYQGKFAVNWNFSCNPQLITLQALTIKLSITIYEVEIGASCLLDKHIKQLITMAGLFSLSAHLKPLFLDQQMQRSHHTKLFKLTRLLLHPKHLCSHTHLTLVCLWQESQISC